MKMRMLIPFFILLALVAIDLTRRVLSRKDGKSRLKLAISIWAIVFAGAIGWSLGSSQEKKFLHAVEVGQTNVVIKMLGEKPELAQVQTIMGQTALNLAIQTSNEVLTEILLQSGADVNLKADSATPLLMAAMRNQYEIAKLLLKAGADVNAKGFRHKDTPLQVAATHGSEELVKLFLSHGADPFARSSLGQTALDCAREGGHSNIVVLLTKLQK